MVEPKKILLIGAGGHCLSVIDSLFSSYHYEKIGIIDKKREGEKHFNYPNGAIMDIPIIGCDEDLELLFSKGYTEAFITVGSIGDASLRKKLYRKLKEIGYSIPNIIDHSSVISSHVSLGEGVYVGKRAVINAGTTIGDLVIINTGTIIEHECHIKDFVHLAPGTVLCGNVCIDRGTHIGAGSVIKQGVQVGAKSIIGMGSVVLKNIDENVIAYGNPCREEKVKRKTLSTINVESSKAEVRYNNE